MALPEINANISGGSKQLGVTRNNTSTTVTRIEGVGYNDQPFYNNPDGEGPKLKYSKSLAASMHYAVFFYGGQAFHVGSLDDSSHGCIHVGEDAGGFHLARQINYHSAIGKTRVNVSYDPAVLKQLK
ncbi:MAG: hypothetical protein U7123_04340 [Potamolinea sp.]